MIFTVSKGPAPIALKDLRGYNEKGLQEYEESSGLKVEYGEEEYHEEVPEGLVIKQDPAPGANLTRGQKVTVVLSKGKKNSFLRLKILRSAFHMSLPPKVSPMKFRLSLRI